METMSPTTIDLDQKTYGQLLRRTLPRVIHSDGECVRLTDELARLDEREDLAPEEKELAELLTVLIDEYEERRYPIGKATPQQTLQHLMEARNMMQKDLWKIFGSKDITSEVFHGKRSISKAQAKRLAAFLHVGVELFI
jgi:HTH-type transcriptional regulator/antitoxin HigA